MTQRSISHREITSELLDPENKYICRIRQLRNVSRAVESAPGNEALNRTSKSSSSTSEWTTDHIYRLQVVVVDQQLDVAMFSKHYTLSDEDKTITAIKEDGFFLPTNKDILAHAWPSTLHNNFFIDLMQLLRYSDTTQMPSNSLQPSGPHEASQSKTHEAISKALQKAKGLRPISYNTGSSSCSLMHNFLKYIACMEHIEYPNLPFWCPR
jgi:hypothetical protein